MVIDSVTNEWLEYFEQCKANNDIRGIFWKMHEICGVPEGVDANDARVVAALAELKAANAGCGDPGA